MYIYYKPKIAELQQVNEKFFNKKNFLWSYCKIGVDML